MSVVKYHETFDISETNIKNYDKLDDLDFILPIPVDCIIVKGSIKKSKSKEETPHKLTHLLQTAFSEKMIVEFEIKISINYFDMLLDKDFLHAVQVFAIPSSAEQNPRGDQFEETKQGFDYSQSW